MSEALTALAALYQNRAKVVDTKIAAINTQISEGKKVLNATQQTEVANLSKKVTSYATPEASIKNAKSVVSLAQTGLTSVTGYLKQMMQMAQMASAPGISSSDSTAFNIRFLAIFNKIGKAASDSSLNGSNLLSGTAGLNVNTGLTKDAASRMHINPVNVFGMMTAGVLTGVSIDTPRKATQALHQIASALTQVRNGEAALRTVNTTLDKKTAEIKTKLDSSLSEIKAMESVDIKKLQAQLKDLHFQQKINYNIVSQLNSSASSSL
jgi:flagellin-like hook-associated protein FlgL